MWPHKDKDEIKFLKVAESIDLDQKGERLFEYGILIGRDVENKGIVRSHHKDNYGNIYEYEALIDLKNEKVIKFKGKRVYYGPISKRLKSKAPVIFISLTIGIGFNLLFGINFLYFVIGIATGQILEEIYFKIVNKRYENRNIINTDNIEMVKRI